MTLGKTAWAVDPKGADPWKMVRRPGDSMNARQRRYLVIDAAVNLLLGLLLLLFPSGIAAWLGAPSAASAFYPSLLGGVLFGIGLALLLEARRRGQGPRGLGMAGAICINFCGAGVLAAVVRPAPEEAEAGAADEPTS